MATQARSTAGKSSLFTSIYGFCRIAAVRNVCIEHSTSTPAPKTTHSLETTAEAAWPSPRSLRRRSQNKATKLSGDFSGDETDTLQSQRRDRLDSDYQVQSSGEEYGSDDGSGEGDSPWAAYISENLMKGTSSDTKRRLQGVNQEFLRILYCFLFAALLEAAGDPILPPGQRTDAPSLYDIPNVSIPRTKPRFLSIVILGLARAFRMALWWTLRSWGQLLLPHVGSIQVTRGIGLFHRRDGRCVLHSSTQLSLLSCYSGWIPLTNVDLEVFTGRSGRQIAISRSVGFVLKTFENEDACEAEVKIYRCLSLNRVKCTPLFYGTYDNVELGIPGIVIEYVGTVLLEDPSITPNDW